MTTIPYDRLFRIIEQVIPKEPEEENGPDLSWMKAVNLKTEFDVCHQKMQLLEDGWRKSNWYRRRHPTGMPSDHKLFMLVYENMFFKKVAREMVAVNKPQPLVPRVRGLEYYFEDVTCAKMRVFEGIGVRYVNTMEDVVVRRIEKGTQRGPEVVPSIKLKEECEAYEILESEQVVAQKGKGEAKNYRDYDWNYSLYMYRKHKDLLEEIKRQVPKIKVVGDAIGYFEGSIDLYPSKYAINPVAQGDVNELEFGPGIWGFMYMRNYINKDTWNRMEGIDQGLVVDLFPPVIKSWVVGSNGWMKKGLVDLHLKEMEQVVLRDPPYTDRLHRIKEELVYLQKGQAQEYLFRAFPKSEFMVAPELCDLLRREGFSVKEWKGEVDYVPLIEDFQMWERKKKGFFVPLGLVNPRVITIRNVLDVYDNSTIYQIIKGKEMLVAKHLKMAKVFTSQVGHTYFYFSRVMEGEVVVRTKSIIRREVFVEVVDNELQVHGPMHFVGHISMKDKETFRRNLLWLKVNMTNMVYERMMDFLRMMNLPALDGWID
jgi:hypothetical protein